MVVTRIGVVGYGTGGRHFHTPFIAAADRVELAGVVTRCEERRAAVARDWPGVPVFDSLADMAASGVDAVTITTPPETRRSLVLEALGLGLHVVADKPFAPSAAVGQEMVDAARELDLLLSVFHNRRWDSDIRTLAAVLSGGELGDLWRVHSRMDQDGAATLEAGPTGGLLRDLGSHVVDQMLWLLGPASAVTAHLDFVDLPRGRTDCGFTIGIQHTSGVRSHVESSKLNHLECRELRAYGSAGSYSAVGTDVQAQAIFAGLRPHQDLDAWGYERPDRWGTLRTAAGQRQIPSAQGRYHDFYTAFGAAVRQEGDQPVPASEGVYTLSILDAARTSATDSCTVQV